MYFFTEGHFTDPFLSPLLPFPRRYVSIKQSASCVTFKFSIPVETNAIACFTHLNDLDKNQEKTGNTQNKRSQRLFFPNFPPWHDQEIICRLFKPVSNSILASTLRPLLVVPCQVMTENGKLNLLQLIFIKEDKIFQTQSRPVPLPYTIIKRNV